MTETSPGHAYARGIFPPRLQGEKYLQQSQRCRYRRMSNWCYIYHRAMRFWGCFAAAVSLPALQIISQWKMMPAISEQAGKGELHDETLREPGWRISCKAGFAHL